MKYWAVDKYGHKLLKLHVETNCKKDAIRKLEATFDLYFPSDAILQAKSKWLQDGQKLIYEPITVNYRPLAVA